MAGYVVKEATNADEAMHFLEIEPADVILVALNLPEDGSSSLLASVRSRPDWEGIPMLAIAESREQMRAQDCLAKGFQDCQVSFDSAAILESVAKLVSGHEAEEMQLECVGVKG